jgi:hypothetical protein
LRLRGVVDDESAGQPGYLRRFIFERLVGDYDAVLVLDDLNMDTGHLRPRSPFDQL